MADAHYLSSGQGVGSFLTTWGHIKFTLISNTHYKEGGLVIL